MEKASVRLQKDFDQWWTEQCELIEAKNNKHSEQLPQIITSTSRGPGKLSIDSASSVASSIQSVNSSLFQSQGGSRPNSSLNSTAMSQLYYNQVSNTGKKILKLKLSLSYFSFGNHICIRYMIT